MPEVRPRQVTPIPTAGNVPVNLASSFASEARELGRVAGVLTDQGFKALERKVRADAVSQIGTWEADTDNAVFEHRKKLTDPNLDVDEWRKELDAILKERKTQGGRLKSKRARDAVAGGFESFSTKSKSKAFWDSERIASRQRISQFEVNADALGNIAANARSKADFDEALDNWEDSYEQAGEFLGDDEARQRLEQARPKLLRARADNFASDLFAQEAVEKKDWSVPSDETIVNKIVKEFGVTKKDAEAIAPKIRKKFEARKAQEKSGTTEEIMQLGTLGEVNEVLETMPTDLYTPAEEKRIISDWEFEQNRLNLSVQQDLYAKSDEAQAKIGRGEITTSKELKEVIGDNPLVDEPALRSMLSRQVGKEPAKTDWKRYREIRTLVETFLKKDLSDKKKSEIAGKGKATQKDLLEESVADLKNNAVKALRDGYRNILRDDDYKNLMDLLESKLPPSTIINLTKAYDANRKEAGAGFFTFGVVTDKEASDFNKTDAALLDRVTRDFDKGKDTTLTEMFEFEREANIPPEGGAFGLTRPTEEQPAELPTVTNKAEFDKLPAGTRYIGPDGQPATKGK